MAPGVENSTSAENVKTAIIADPYSLEWWNSAWHAPWGYQRDRFIFDAMHDMNRDPSSSDLKRESYHDPPTMSPNPKYSVSYLPSALSSNNLLHTMFDCRITLANRHHPHSSQAVIAYLQSRLGTLNMPQLMREAHLQPSRVLRTGLGRLHCTISAPRSKRISNKLLNTMAPSH